MKSAGRSAGKIDFAIRMEAPGRNGIWACLRLITGYPSSIKTWAWKVVLETEC
jgi:hypothetical protein